MPIGKDTNYGVSFLFFKWKIDSRKGNCKNVSLNLECEVGLRRRTYNVLSGSVLSVWSRIENVLAAKTGHNTKMQVVRLKTAKGIKIVGMCVSIR